MSTEMSKKISTEIVCCIIITAIAAIMLFCFSTGISGNDFWWHIKVGEFICQNHTVPTTDIFSWIGTQNAISWTPHEWLADVLIYQLFHLAGEIGVFVFSVGCAGAMTFLMWKNCKKYIRYNPLISGLFFSLFAVLTSLFFYGRPHIFSFFFLFFELKILYRFWDDNDDKGIYFLPLLTVFWSNMHGGSANLSYLLCVLFLVVGSLKFEFGRIEAARLSKKGRLVLLLVTVGTVVGILINPVGRQVFVYPYVSFADTLSMTVISEWRAPDAKNIGDLVLYFLPIILMSIGLISGQKKIRFIDLMVMGIFLFLFFRSARFIIMWYIAASFYAFRYMPQCKIKEIRKKSELFVVSLVFVILLAAISMSVVSIGKTYHAGDLISTAMGDEAVRIVKSDDPQRLFNDYNVGETLIYHGIPVFFDARADLYSANHILQDGVSLMFLEQANTETEVQYVDVDSFIDKYGFDGVLILKVRPLYSYMKSHPDRFELVFEDGRVGYYKVRDEGEE